MYIYGIMNMKGIDTIMNMLNTKNLCFLKDIRYKDCCFQSDKVSFITGASGTGKSSLLKLLSYNTLPTSGQVDYNNQNILEYSPYEYRRLVTLILQDVFLFDGTIEDNFRYFYEYRERTMPTKEAIYKLMEVCVLNMPLDKNVSQMSGGERQRLYISIIISFKPHFLLLDEPTSALDTENSFKVVHNLITYTKAHEIGLIIVSHDTTLVKEYAETILDLGGDGLVK